MGWPKGVPRKLNNIQIAPLIKTVDGIHYDAIFAIRFLRNGPFPGLWELVKVDHKMNRIKVITDANARGQVQTLLAREVKRIVV